MIETKLKETLKQTNIDKIVSAHRDYLLRNKALTFETFRNNAQALRLYNKLTLSDITLIWKRINKANFITLESAQYIARKEFKLKALKDLQDKTLYAISKNFLTVIDTKEHRNLQNYIGCIRIKQDKKPKRSKQAYNVVLSRKDYYTLKRLSKLSDFNLKLLGYKIIPKNERLIDKRDTVKNQMLRFSEKYNNQPITLDNIKCEHKKACNRNAKALTSDNKYIDYPNDCSYCLQAQAIKSDYIKRFRKSYLVSYKMIDSKGLSIKDYLNAKYTTNIFEYKRNAYIKQYYAIYDKSKLFSLKTLDYIETTSETKRLLYKSHTTTKHYSDLKALTLNAQKNALKTNKTHRYLKSYKSEYTTKQLNKKARKLTTISYWKPLECDLKANLLDTFGKLTSDKAKELLTSDKKHNTIDNMLVSANLSDYSSVKHLFKLFRNFDKYNAYLSNLLTMIDYKLNKEHNKRIKLRKQYSKRKRSRINLSSEYNKHIRNAYNLNLENNNDLVLKQARKRDLNAFNRIKTSVKRKLDKAKALKPNNQESKESAQAKVLYYSNAYNRLESIKFNRLTSFNYERSMITLYNREYNHFKLFFNRFLLNNVDLKNMSAKLYKQYKPLANLDNPYSVINYIDSNKLLNAYFKRIFDKCIFNISFISKQRVKS